MTESNDKEVRYTVEIHRKSGWQRVDIPDFKSRDAAIHFAMHQAAVKGEECVRILEIRVILFGTR